MSNESVFGQIRQSNNPDGEHFVFTGGLTIRDYFAGLAMQGMLSDTRNPTCEIIAKWAYEMADRMLEERDKCS